MTDPEADRIRSVYAAYDEDSRVQARRDPGNRANLLIEAELTAALDSAVAGLTSIRLPDAAVLDVGCGAGDELARLEAAGATRAHLHGIDLLPDRIVRARERLPGADLREGDARELPYAAASMDLVVLRVVLSSVLDPGLRARIAAEADRVLRPGGALLYYDNRYPSPFNRHVRGITRRELGGLFAGYDQRLRTVTVVPPLVRRLGALTDAAYSILARVPPLNVRYVGVLVKPRGGFHAT
jgi:ubiquinone/menaquinone biosynthesis C-methylase UbiE